MIRVLIVDDAPLTRANIERLLDAETDISAVGTAGDSASALSAAQQLQPDVVLVDLDLPDGSGLQTAQTLVAGLSDTAVILMGLDDDDETRNASARTGAADYLLKPFGGDELLRSIRRVAMQRATAHAPRPLTPAPSMLDFASAPVTPSAGRQVVAVMSAKGGTGSTVIAANLALIIAQEARRRVALVDLDIEHGHIQRLLRLGGRTTSIIDAVRGGPSVVASCLAAGPAGVSVLAAPAYSGAELDPVGVQKVLGALRETYDLVVLDVPNRLGPVEAAALDIADRVILLSQMSDLGVRATAGLRGALEGSGVPPECILVVLNRVEANSDLTKANVEEALRTEVGLQLPYDPILVSTSMNRGAPFVLQRPDAQVSRKLRDLAAMLVPMPAYAGAGEPEPAPTEAAPAEAAEEQRPRRRQRKGLFGFART